MLLECPKHKNANNEIGMLASVKLLRLDASAWGNRFLLPVQHEDIADSRGPAQVPPWAKSSWLGGLLWTWWAGDQYVYPSWSFFQIILRLPAIFGSQSFIPIPVIFQRNIQLASLHLLLVHRSQSFRSFSLNWTYLPISQINPSHDTIPYKSRETHTIPPRVVQHTTLT
jgi:hypothetical protein